MTITITAVSSQVGSGKTYLIQVMGHILAQMGFRVLLIDTDPKNDLTSNLLSNILTKKPNELSRTLLWAMLNPEESEYSVRRVRKNLYVLPSNTNLIESTILTDSGSLIPVIQHLKESYDYILIDTPSSGEIFIAQALMAADKVFIPLQIELYIDSRIDYILDALITCRISGNNNLDLVGIVSTTQKKNTLEIAKLIELIKSKLNDMLFETVMMLENDISADKLNFNSYENIAYSNFTREFLKRI